MRALFPLLALLCSMQVAMATMPPKMVEETAVSGVEHTYTGPWEFYVGGGVAVFDCNGDAYPDMFAAGGRSESGLYVNRSRRGDALSFVRSPLTIDDTIGAYPLDVDGDGHIDLAVLRLGENILLRGRGNCRFERANEAWRFDGGSGWTTGFSATWERGKAWPTLAFGNYVDRDKPGSPWGTCEDNALYRPNAGGVGYQMPLTLAPGFCSLSILFSDWNRSGHASLRISNDRQYYKGGQEQLWVMTPGEMPRLAGRKDGWRKLKIWGMGIASHDLTGDGHPEYFLTSMGDNKMRTLAQGSGRPAYQDMAHKIGVTAHRPHAGGEVLPSTAWHAQFDDVNNDGLVDLFIAKGNVESMQDFARRDPNNLLLQRADLTFAEASEAAGIASFEKSRGAALADFNLDGLLDLVAVNREAPLQVWRNVGGGNAKDPAPMGNWIALALAQDRPNRHAVGAWIEVRSGRHLQRKEVTVGGGHAGGVFSWHHFGVGVAERLSVRIQWPDGEWGPWIRLFANQFARIERGKAEASLWLPPPVGKGNQ